MNNKSKLFLAFGAGALVAGAVAALFSTKEGKEVMAKAKNKLDDLSEDIKGKMKDFEKEVSDFLKEPKENPGA